MTEALAFYHTALAALQTAGIEPFSLAAGFMSLEGAARLLAFLATGIWV